MPKDLLKDKKIKILNKLIDKYESSKTFCEKNKKTQSFAIELKKIFNEYGNDTDYELYLQITECLKELMEQNFIKPVNLNKFVDKVELNLATLNSIYLYVDRKDRKAQQNELIAIIQSFNSQNESTLAKKYCEKLLIDIKENKTTKFDDDTNLLKDYLTILKEIELLKEETLYRDFSARIIKKSSKFFEKHSVAISKIVYDLTDLPCERDESENILGFYNLVKNPREVYFKGNGKVYIDDIYFDVSKLKGGLRLSSIDIQNIKSVVVECNKIVTIENLTSFNKFYQKDCFSIYLGGFHNKIRREFIGKIYKNNPTKTYYHFGDIDAGGFRIYYHLKEKTGIDFQLLYMDVDTLIKNKDAVIELTKNDRINLEEVAKKHPELNDIVEYMLRNNCKLEQEVIIC